MNLKKILLGALALTASAKVSTFVGAGVTGGFQFPGGKTGKIFTKGAQPNAMGEDFESDDSDTSVKFSSKAKGFNPAGVFATAAVTFDELIGVMSFGLGFDFGYRWNLGLPTDKLYGKNADFVLSADAKTETRGFTVTYPDGGIFMIPQVLIGVDVMDMHILFSAGLDISKEKLTLKYALKTSDARPEYAQSMIAGYNVTQELDSWVFGLRFGLSAIFQVAPCAGVGVGVFFTYWPTMFNDDKTEGAAAKFDTTAGTTAKDAVVYNVGGTYSITGQITGHVALG